jgi:uncharacterized membrane protein
MDHLLYGLTLLAALGCGLIAGVFFAFSAFVMTALARIAPASGIAAMQSINIVVINPLFLGVFFGTALICLALAVAELAMWRPPASAWLLAGSALYLVGTILVTMRGNVPLNNALAAVEPGRRRRRQAVDALPRPLDQVEPRAHGRRPRRCGGVHRRAALANPNSHDGEPAGASAVDEAASTLMETLMLKAMATFAAVVALGSIAYAQTSPPTQPPSAAPSTSAPSGTTTGPASGSAPTMGTTGTTTGTQHQLESLREPGSAVKREVEQGSGATQGSGSVGTGQPGGTGSQSGEKPK